MLTKEVYRGYKFSVSINAGQGILTRTAFQKVTGLKSSVEVIEYREGNMPDRMEKFAGMMPYDSVTLERGISNDDDFNTWIQYELINAFTSEDTVRDFDATSNDIVISSLVLQHHGTFEKNLAGSPTP